MASQRVATPMQQEETPFRWAKKEVEDIMFKSLALFTQGIADVKFSDEVSAYRSVLPNSALVEKQFLEETLAFEREGGSEECVSNIEIESIGNHRNGLLVQDASSYRVERYPTENKHATKTSLCLQRCVPPSDNLECTRTTHTNY